MNSNIKLPSGKILNLNRFIALLPETDAKNNRYLLILEGLSHIIYLNQNEADMVKKHLELQANRHKSNIWDKEEQLRKNQPAIKLLKERIKKHKLMSDEESKQKEEFFTDFQKTIDAERTLRKLYET